MQVDDLFADGFDKMNKTDIQSREDVGALVRNFYTRVRQHPAIGKFFTETITDWEVHLEHLTDFWESNLFMVNRFKGNPMRKHIHLDKNFNHSLEQVHFGHWLELWVATVDSLYIGEKANLAKERARNIAHILFLRIFQARNVPGRGGGHQD